MDKLPVSPKPQHMYCVYYANHYANMSDPC